MFPPFSILGHTLQTLETDRARSIIVVLLGTTQHWLTKLLQLLMAPPLLLPRTNQLLKLPMSPTEKHPLTKMRLIAFKVSGKLNDCPKYRETLQKFFCNHGEDQYWTYFQKWLQFCERQSYNPYQASITQILEFLLELYNKGLGYSSINTAKSCISSRKACLAQKVYERHF